MFLRMTAKTHYATTALIDLALHEHQGPVALSVIAERQRLSPSYLEQLFVRLRGHGLVVSIRGRSGGYQLGRLPDTISVANITDAIGESIDSTSCHGHSNCNRSRICLSHHLWVDLSEHIYDFLDSIKLSDLLNRNKFSGPELPCNAQAKKSGHVEILAGNNGTELR